MKGQKMHTRGKGKVREEQALQYLLEKGYIIIEQNYRTRHGEIDCIAQDPVGTLVFCEVKSSWGGRGANPLYWVNARKQRTLGQMARRYLYEQKRTDVPCRFDVIGISSRGIDHIRNAFFIFP
jgi:putative endonuclease